MSQELASGLPYIARHDNDRKQPRTLKEIYQLNRAMAKRMEEIFVSKGIPVIPSIGMQVI